jgi:hypothetical protein
MNKALLDSNLKTADLHIKRLEYAIKKLKPLFPISVEHILHLTDEEVLIFELFASRFTKLQDLMGAKLFGQVLDYAAEPGEYIAFIDKVNKLEKLGIIPDAQKWFLLREMRNHLSHEYPDNPELTAKNLNEAFEITNYLLLCLQNIKAFVQKIEERR